MSGRYSTPIPKSSCCPEQCDPPPLMNLNSQHYNPHMCPAPPPPPALPSALPMPVLVAWRSRRSTALRLFAPFLFLLMALIVNLALNANNALQERFTAVPLAQGVDIPHIPSCGDDLYIAGRPCVDFVWTPNNDTAAEVRVDQGQAAAALRQGGCPGRCRGLLCRRYVQQQACCVWFLRVSMFCTTSYTTSLITNLLLPP